MKKYLCAVLFLSVLLLSAGQSIASPIDILPTADAALSTDNPNTNYGNAYLAIQIGDYHHLYWVSILKFTLPTLSVGETISSALLELYQYSGLDPYEIHQGTTLYRSSNNSWSEGM